MSQTYYATINPGLEDALLEEIRELGGRRAKKLRGGVEFEASNTSLYDIILRVRCANRIVLRVDEFRARDFPELYNKTERIDWARLLGDVPVEVRASASESRLIHTGRIEETVSEAIVASRGSGGSGPRLLVLVRMHDDRCQLSLDASGDLLYMRGWRRDSVAAPLRESIAASLLRLSSWTPGQPIVDPCCGSGTFVIEAAQRAKGIAAGAHRTFSIEHWGHLRHDVWDESRSRAKAQEQPSRPVHFGFDSSPAAIEAANANARRARVAEVSAFACQSIADMQPPDCEPGWIMANPPYGVRLDSKSVYNELLQVYVDRFEGWRMGLIAPSDVDLGHPAVRASRDARFSNGGIDVSWWTFEHPA